MKDFIKDLSKDLKINKIDKKEDGIIIYCKSTKKEETCKCCGRKTKSKHSFYDKTVQDISFSDKQVTLIISAKIFICRNSECENTTFSEVMDYIDTYERRTNRLNEYILDIVSDGNSHSAEKKLKKHGIKISDTSIDRLIKKKQSNCGKR